nr:MAG TPA: hypothetical protein [Caudoviricetes sp.]
MASEIKIHLATYLKDEGIKASQQQIDKLATDVKRMNSEMQRSTDKTVQRLGKMEGAFGKIQDCLSGFAAKAMSVIGAFKLGWDIGTWINEKVVTPLFGLKDPIEELKKHNRELKRQAEEAVQKWEEAFEKWSAGWEKEVQGADRARQSIEDLTQAYLKMQAARERVQSAQDDAQMLGMQRDKFDAMAGASTPEEATAIGKYHDVLIAEAQQKQQLAEFDRRAEESAQKQASAEQQLAEAVSKRRALKQQMAELDKKQAYVESRQSVEDLGWEGSIKEEERVKKQKEQLQRQLDAANRDVRVRRADIQAMSASRTAEAQERANIEERARLEVDERKKAYDDYVAEVERKEAEAAEAEWQRQQEQARRIVEAEREERARMEQQLAAQRIADLRTELSERQRMEGDAKSRQSAAAGGLAQAWGWYRNQSSMQAVIDEQKTQALAEAQWEKDFERLKFKHRDWREIEFGKLSAADESVRQVALAKEEKEAADRAVIETAENTRQLADKLDELLSVKG